MQSLAAFFTPAPSHSALISADEQVAGYLVDRKLLAVQQNRIPVFEDVCECLLPVQCWETAPPYVFVSHRWMYDYHVDNELCTQSIALQMFFLQTDIQYYWIDCVCLPREDSEKELLLKELQLILLYASLYLVMPFSPNRKTLVPSYDVQEYALRAWCAFEFCIMIRMPQKIRIARLAKNTNSVGVKFIQLPSHILSDDISSLLAGFVCLKDLLFRDKPKRFFQTFSASIASDKLVVWNYLQEIKDHVISFNHHTSDFVITNHIKGGGQKKKDKYQLIYKLDNVMILKDKAFQQAHSTPIKKQVTCACYENAGKLCILM